MPHYTYTDCMIDDYVNCYECGERKDLRMEKMHKREEGVEEISNDGSYVPVYSYTCEHCYGGVPYHGNTSLSLINIEKKVDNLQKTLDDLQKNLYDLQETLHNVKKVNNTNSKNFSFIKIVFVTLFVPFLCLLLVYLHLTIVLAK